MLAVDTTTEPSRLESLIQRRDPSMVAFIGRTLRGPLNQPIVLTSFAEFQSRFGGLWQPSPLSYAIEQFFENGGQSALVVRVSNGARPVTLGLPVARGEDWVLEARCPGTREFLRAAVDYDNLPLADESLFNLVVQRVRAAGHEHIEDQEIFRRVSVDPESPRWIGVLLAKSALVRLKRAGRDRPLPTMRSDPRLLAGYVLANADGDDGAPLTDYDVIGSAANGTGLFAFGSAPSFGVLYIPSLARDVPIGPSARLIALRVVRAHRAMLLVDPPGEWVTPEAALIGVRHHELASDDVLMYYPSIRSYDRLRGQEELFPPGAAAAGLLSRLGVECPCWIGGEAEDGVLRPGLRPSQPLSDDWRERLAQAGLNTLSATRSRRPLTARTLVGLHATGVELRQLSHKRLMLMIIDSIERGTRWALLESPGAPLWRRVESQVSRFLESLAKDGAFPVDAGRSTWFAICDERLHVPSEPQALHLLFGFVTERADIGSAWLLSHEPGKTQLQRVALDHFQSSGARLQLAAPIDLVSVIRTRWSD